MTIDFRGYEPMPQHEVDLEMQRSFERTAAAERERLAHCRAQEAVTEVQHEPCQIQTVEQAKQKMEEMRRNGFRRVMSPEEVELEALLAEISRSLREPDTAPAADMDLIAATDGSELIIVAETDEDPTVAEVGGTPEFSAPSITPAPTVDVLEPSPVTPGPSVVDHEFPIAHVPALIEGDDPLSELQMICYELASHKDYRRVRAAYCENSLLLNQMGKLAPGFRPVPRSGAQYKDPIHQLINRDQQVIDLHWCHATRMSLSPNEPDHAALFADPDQFNLDAAWALSGKKWRKGFRAEEALCLTTLQQAQLVTLHSAELRAKFDGLGGEWRTSGGKTAGRFARVKRDLGVWCERDSRMLAHRRSYEMLWLARELLGKTAAPGQIASLHALMLGEAQLGRVSVRDKLKKLDQHVTLK